MRKVYDLMDERIGYTGILQAAVLSASVLLLLDSVHGEEPRNASPLKARLASGFGAGTNQNLFHPVPMRSAIVRPAPRVIPTPVIPTPASPSTVMDTTPVPDVVRPAISPSASQKQSDLTEVEGIVIEAPPTHAVSEPCPQDDRLAALIRQDRQSNNSRVSTDCLPTEGTDSTTSSIRVEMAPRVRRIKLGSYNPNRPEQTETNGIVRLAEPVHAKLLEKPKPRTIQVPPLSEPPAFDEPVRASNASAAGLSAGFELPVHGTSPTEPIRAALPLASAAVEQSNPRGDLSAMPSVDQSGPLMHALADPDLSELIEAQTLDQASQADQPPARVSSRRWQSFSYDRSRRLATSSGFDLLPLEQLETD